MKQTAVEFLSEKYMYVTWLRNRDEISASWADKLRAEYFDQAKEMEKEQIIRARQDGLDNGFSNGSWDSNLYYNETHGDDT